jgi:hypothetical protein
VSFAAQYGYVSVLKALLEAGADINQRGGVRLGLLCIWGARALNSRDCNAHREAGRRLCRHACLAMWKWHRR